jgi:hypothetical protein
MGRLDVSNIAHRVCKPAHDPDDGLPLVFTAQTEVKAMGGGFRFAGSKSQRKRSLWHAANGRTAGHAEAGTGQLPFLPADQTGREQVRGRRLSE